MIPNPWLILAGVVFLLVSHGWAFNAGITAEHNRNEAEKQKATQKVIEQAEKQAGADNKLVSEAEKVQERIKIEYRYIREKVNANIDQNPNYADCSLDTDGLRLFNADPNTEANIPGKPSN